MEFKLSYILSFALVLICYKNSVSDFKKIPPLELAYTNGQVEKFNTKIQTLQAAIDEVKATGSSKVTFTFSLPKPGSIFPMTYNKVDGGMTEEQHLVKDIEQEYTIGQLTVQDVKTVFEAAFQDIKELIEYDVPGLEINLKAMGSGYESDTRTISQYDTDRVPVGNDRYQAGDIKIMFLDFEPESRIANGYAEYRSVLGKSTNNGLSITFNTNAHFRMDDDPELLKFPSVDNDIELYRFSLRATMVHELAHLLGVGHSHNDNPSFTPTIMNSNARAGVPYTHRFPNGLWQDYWLRACLAHVYNYSLDNSLMKEGYDATE